MQHSHRLTGQKTAPLKILLAEDNLTNQKLALRQLQILGYAADVVTNGKAAIEAAIQSHYDLVLMDCQMPVLDGFEATAAIRAWEHQHLARPIQTIVVAMTASDSTQDRERAIAVGMDDYLTKPVRQEMLMVLLNHWSQMLAMNLLSPKWSGLNSSHKLSASLKRLPAHLDLEHLRCLSDDKPEFEIELLQIFLEDSRRHLEILKQAVFRQDWVQIQHSIHHLRGASANVGARAMQLVAEHLEEHRLRLMQPDVMPSEMAIVQELIAKLEFSLEQIQGFVAQMRTVAQSA